MPHHQYAHSYALWRQQLPVRTQHSHISAPPVPKFKNAKITNPPPTQIKPPTQNTSHISNPRFWAEKTNCLSDINKGIYHDGVAYKNWENWFLAFP